MNQFGISLSTQHPTGRQRSAGPHACARCAAMGPTCCWMTPGHGEDCFPLARVEMDRIRDFAGEHGWFTSERNSGRFLSNLGRLFPDEKRVLRKLFHAHGMHFRLATDESGRCRLLGERGCTLPREARPTYCRIFPLWVDQGRILTLDAPCLARQEAGGIRELTRALETTPARILHLYDCLRMAWGLPPTREWGEDGCQPTGSDSRT